MKRRFLLLTFFALLLWKSLAFESDELPDDEEWGFTGRDKSVDSEVTRPSLSSLSASEIRKPRFPSSAESSADSKINITFGHSFSDSPFSPAGFFTARLKTFPHGGQTLTKLRITRSYLSRDEQQAFAELLKEDDFYRIRLPSNVVTPGKDYVFSSIKSRCLVKDELEERFIIHMEGVNIIAVTYAASGECPYPRPLRQPKRWTFNSHAVLKSSEQATRMPLVAESLLGNPNAEGIDELDKPPEKSFWAKYWMYLIPLGMIVMNAMAQAMNMPEEQASGQQAGQAGQASAQGPQRISQAGPRRR
eukprot:TRINITY_DN17190_c0_g1_i1.p1 TRINITY_DN17190_c0_g1~~TRINITY_DN17190_c0_g1_i1.p1  ORF type:complete len:304 (-),score=49.64 TRINITY_DN17190_c0_g1_i1:321-1232(-)